MDRKPRLALIVARDRTGVIGRDGDLPWRLPDDLAFFKRVTMGKPLCMGRKTWESLPKRPLPGRANLVLSRQPDYAAPGALVFADFDAMLTRAYEIAAADGAEEVMVIGGAALYARALPSADRLYLSEVDVDAQGDARFPAFEDTNWVEIERVAHPADVRHAHGFVRRVLDRKPSVEG